MKPTSSTFLGIVVLGLSLAGNADADLRVKSKYVAGGQSNETTVHTKGARQRFEPGAGMAMINQNDLSRIIQLFDEKKMYMIMSADGLAAGLPGAQQPRPAAVATPTGGVVNLAIALTDTGERKQMFGFMARRVKSTMTREAGPGTCDPGNDTIETDGWYIDYMAEGAATPATAAAAPPMPAGAPACKDDVRVKQTGNGTLGYPLAYSFKTTRDGKTTEMSMEVVEFATTPIDAALFEIPAGYTELKGFGDLSAAFAGDGARAGASAPVVPGGGLTTTAPLMPKVAGAIRVGVADLNNRTGQSLGPASPRDQLIAELLRSNVDAIPLQGQNAADVQAAAKAQECDFILFTDVTEVKKASGGLGRLGGALNRAASIAGGSGAAPKEKIEAKVEYRLIPIDGARPLMSASSNGSNGGGFNVSSAINLAMAVSPLGLYSRMGLLDPNMMRLLSNSGGMGLGAGGLAAIPGMPRGGMDPGLGPFMAAMQATQSAMAPPEPSEEAKAVGAAFADAAKKVSEALRKRN